MNNASSTAASSTAASSSSRLGALLLALAVAPALGCGLIQVNGKPLGGGSTSAPSAPTYGAPDRASGTSTADAPATATGKTLAQVARPSGKVAVTAWTPAQQYLREGGWGSYAPEERQREALGYGKGFPSLVLADDLGDKLSHLGRLSLIEECFHQVEPTATAAVIWAVCGADVRAVDLARAEAELRAEGIGAAERKRVLADSAKLVAAAKEVGAVVEAAAKDEPGLAAVLAAGEAARAEWKAFAGGHRALLETVDAMQGAVRANHAQGFAGCVAKTRPGFEKLVRATKLAEDTGRDPLVAYVAQLRGDLTSYLTTLAYAACAYGHHDSAEGLYAAIGNGGVGVVLRGARTLALARLYAASFKPKFADRALSMPQLRSAFQDHPITVPVNANTSIATPTGGKLTKVTTRGEVTTLGFATDKVERCLDWRTTSKVQSIASNGEVRYEMVCAKRGPVDSQTSDLEIATTFAAGLEPGMWVTLVNRFPVIAWRNQQPAAVLGVALR